MQGLQCQTGHRARSSWQIIEAHSMASFELTPADGAELPAFSADSHVDVSIPADSCPGIALQ